MAELTAVRRPPYIPPAVRTAGRIALAAAVIVAAGLAVGVGPFVRGIASVSPVPIAGALLLALIATSAAAWRWRVVAAGLGLPLRWRASIAAYYRSQFLNTVLPGGVLGDAHRAYAHGRETVQAGNAARAVAAERIAGQVVQTAVTLAILLPLGLASALAPLGWSAAVLIVGVLVAVVAVAATPRGRRALTRELAMLRPLLARPRTLLVVVTASTVVVAAYVAMFVVAAAAVGVSAGPRELAPIALAVLSASAIPINVGGWGPREAASAGAFALAGIGGSIGVEVSVAFGVLGMIAVAPGAIVLLGDRIRARRERVRT
jgi:uncharacterized membrane protein YbhN (UPF0104 family)